MSNIIPVEVSDVDLQNLGFLKIYMDCDSKIEVGVQNFEKRPYINLQEVAATEQGLREFIKIQCVRSIVKTIAEIEDLSKWYFSAAVFGIRRDQFSTLVPIMQISMICSYRNDQFDVIADCIYLQQQFQTKHIVTFQNKVKGLCDAVLMPFNTILSGRSLQDSQNIMPYKAK